LKIQKWSPLADNSRSGKGIFALTQNFGHGIIIEESIALSGKAVQSFLGDEVVEMNIMELLTLLIVVIEIIKLNSKKK
jgi:hypothetical protein